MKPAANLRVRLKESLRAKIEASAKKRGISLNADTVERLAQSFRDDRILKELHAMEARLTKRKIP